MGPLHKMDQFHYHELLDRTDMVAQIVEDHLVQHPLTKVMPKLTDMLDEVTIKLAEVYQTVGHISMIVELVSSQLDVIDKDYQLNTGHRDYVGFLNTDPKNNWDYNAFHALQTMIEQFPGLFENLCLERELRVESKNKDLDEMVFVRIETMD